MARVLVTGASRGLGRALVVELKKRGHAVIATARRIDDLADLEVANKVALDVTDPASVAAAAAAAGAVDVVINNAAITVEGPLEALPMDAVRSVFETNVFGALRVMQAFLPGMRERRSGMIINISSVGGRFAPPLQGVYAASKAALEMLSEALRFEARHFGVRVVVVAPGGIRTGMTERQARFSLGPYAPLVEQVRARFERYAPRGGSPPETIARAIADVIEQDDPPLRVPVGAFADRLLARLGGRLVGRLVRMGLNW